MYKNVEILSRQDNVLISVKINKDDVRDWDFQRVLDKIKHSSSPGKVLTFVILQNGSFIPGIPVQDVSYPYIPI